MFVEDLTLTLTDIITSPLERVELHVRLTLSTCLRRAFALLTRRVTLNAQVADLDADVRDAFLDAAVVEEVLPRS